LKQSLDLAKRGQLDAAISAGESSLEVCEKKVQHDPLCAAAAQTSLALLYLRKRDLGRAETLYLRALEIFERQLGAGKFDVAGSLINLAKSFAEAGDSPRAVGIYLRALEALEKKHGPEHADVASLLHILGGLYRETGAFSKSEQAFKRALAIRQKVLGGDHHDVAWSMSRLGGLYRVLGNYNLAEKMYKDALAILEKKIGPKSPEVAVILDNLGLAYQEKGDDERAKEMHTRAVVIFEEVLGPTDTDLAVALDNLAGVYKNTDNYAEAGRLYQRALAIKEQNLQPDHPNIAITLDNLANVYQLQGDDAKAEPLRLRALSIFEKAYGPVHLDVAIALSNLAALFEAKGDIKAAVAFRARSTEIYEHTLSTVLSMGSEGQKQLYMALLTGGTYAVISLHVRHAPNDLQALHLALTTVLRRKGRVLSAMSDQIAALRGRLNSQDKALFDDLLLIRSRLSALLFNKPAQSTPAQHLAAIAKLEEEVQQLEAAVSAHSSEFRALSQPVSIEALRKLIPSGTALVELVSYKPFNSQVKAVGKAYGSGHYVAYVLRREGEPSFVDLGEAAPINQAVLQLRSALANPKSLHFKQVARALDELLMRPIRRLLGETRMVLLSPDGELNLVPFGALVDEQGRYLVENYTFNYLTSGRDLLRLETQTEPRQQPVVIANPSFDLAVTIGDQKVPEGSDSKGRRSLDFQTPPIKPLPGTAQEASAIKSIIPSALVLTEGAATEATLKQVAGPRVLHIATHGFFLKDQLLRTVAAWRRSDMDEVPRAAQGENPILRSGLVLAGVTKGQSGAGEDGVLTAFEATGLDLWGTKLVVLSACETAVGDVSNGEGVYGLRRALVLAGAESQLMSLWKVSDAGTRDLMTAYYTRLQKGEGRAEALRQVQLAMLHGRLLPVADSGKRETSDTGKAFAAKDYRHPYYWAAFIQSGDWRSMDGK
jgi:CHAT domain-containing protein/tetratricopeptide (TPR) repeat protein